LEKEQFERLCDVEILFHILLFVHKAVIHDILGTGAAVFEHPTYNALKAVLEKEGITLAKGENLKEALDNYARMLEKSGLVKKVWFEQPDSDGYILHIDGCVYAKRLHSCLKPFLKGQSCRYALLAAAIFQKFHGSKPKLEPSIFTEEGTKTRIKTIT
jgi:hypothetical protein